MADVLPNVEGDAGQLIQARPAALVASDGTVYKAVDNAELVAANRTAKVSYAANEAIGQRRPSPRRACDPPQAAGRISQGYHSSPADLRRAIGAGDPECAPIP
jgi:hypothetical protein